jgi:ubiquinone/menaquinone biosynthesis C-methylase UbiE
MTTHVESSRRLAGDESETLFDRFHWLYAFCRERLFRDDTERIAATLWPGAAPPAGARLLEIGCGPGFYSRRLAGRFAQLRVVGIDRAEEQLRRARLRAAAQRLDNCSFERGDALALAWPGAAFDAVVASRLFTILPGRERALAEMRRVLRPEGRCFIAEPRSVLRAAVPLHIMWLAARVLGFCRESPGSYREPRRAAVLPATEFRALIESQPWESVRYCHDTWYQYAVCEQGAGRGASGRAAHEEPDDGTRRGGKAEGGRGRSRRFGGRGGDPPRH